MPDEASRLARLEERLSWAVGAFTECNVSIRKLNEDVQRAVSEIRVSTVNQGHVESEVREIRADLDQLINALAEERKERRAQRIAVRWQRVTLVAAVITWFVAQTITIAVAAGVFR